MNLGNITQEINNLAAQNLTPRLNVGPLASPRPQPDTRAQKKIEDLEKELEEVKTKLKKDTDFY